MEFGDETPFSNDIESARTNVIFFAQQPGHSNHQAPWSPNFDPALQSLGVQNG